MDYKKLENFLTTARTKTYAGGGGKVTPVLPGSYQLEYQESEYLYRDIYYVGRGIFMGLETVYYKYSPAWSMCYYGNFKKATEKEIDGVLRKALIENWQTTRLWNYVEWLSGSYKYVCVPDYQGSIEEMAGSEKIFKDNQQIYYFYYAGGLIWTEKEER